MSGESKAPREAAEVQQWILAARRGDRQALGRLLELCRPYLMLIANEELSPALQAKIAPSDLVQSTFLEAGRDFSRFQGASEQDLLGWLRRMLRNNLADARRRFETRKRNPQREIPLEESDVDALLHEAIQQSETPSSQALAQEQDEQLEQAMRRLPEHYRQVLELHTGRGLTFVEIADMLGSTADAVRKLWARAAEELGKQLDSPHEST